MTFRLIIFDVDGVLGKEEKLAKARRDAQIRYVSEKLGIPVPEARARYASTKETMPADRRNTSAYVFVKLGFSREEYFQVVDGVDPEGLTEPYENCVETLQKLERKHKLVTYSNTPAKASERTLDVLGIRKHITRIYSAEQFAESKPSTAILEKILSDMKCSPSDTILVGNSIEKDIMPAHKLGITTVLFEPAGTKTGPLAIDYLVSDLAQIVHIVQK